MVSAGRRLLSRLTFALLAFLTPATATVPARTTVYIVGDSTAMTYLPRYRLAPQQGWGARIGEYFNQGVAFDNRAISGRSAKSFHDEGRFADILDRIGPGDFLFIQFGHNDSAPAPTNPTRHTEPQTSFKTYLDKYIEGARAKGALPVLITPMTRRQYDAATGRFMNTHADYANAMRELGAARRVAVVNLDLDSVAYLDAAGFDASARLFMVLKAGEHRNFPEGANDGTHFQEYGADRMARLIADSIGRQNIGGLASRLTR